MPRGSRRNCAAPHGQIVLSAQRPRAWFSGAIGSTLELMRGGRGIALMCCLGQHVSLLAHLCGPLNLVPVEGLSIDSTLERLEQHDGEDLAIGKALQPDMEQQPDIALVCGVAAFQREVNRRSEER